VELVQTRILTDDVERLATFYAALVGTQVALNEYHVEVPAGPASVGISKRRCAEYQEHNAARCGRQPRQAKFMLDFLVADADAEHERIDALQVDWLLPPTAQPWGTVP